MAARPLMTATRKGLSVGSSMPLPARAWTRGGLHMTSSRAMTKPVAMATRGLASSTPFHDVSPPRKFIMDVDGDVGVVDSVGAADTAGAAGAVVVVGAGGSGSGP